MRTRDMTGSGTDPGILPFLEAEDRFRELSAFFVAKSVDELCEQAKNASLKPYLELIASLPVLAVEPAIVEIAETYITRHVMPADPAGDALHLALASFHHCDFLVTWNCQHLANANKFGHIRRVNTLLGLYVPLLVTPLELLAGGDDET